MKIPFSGLLLLLLIAPLSTIKAQLCNGTLGDPIFTETFGAGTGPGAALPAGTTNYLYSSQHPSDGRYTISNTSNPAPMDQNWLKTKDHTGDPNGYMLVVNASYAAGEFYNYTVTGLCPNTTYVFDAWIANVNDSNKVMSFCNASYQYPNVTFKIQDTGAGTSNSISTGKIFPSNGQLKWHQYGFTFSTGPGQSSVIMTMLNNGSGGCGNDLVIDDISFRACGPSTNINPVPLKKLYCSGESLLLNAVIGPGYNNPVYQWQFSTNNGVSWQDLPGATNKDLTLNPLNTLNKGLYRLKLAENGNLNSEKCRVITDPVAVDVAPTPNITVTAAPAVICSGSSSTLSASGADNFSWSNGSTGPSILVSPTSTTTYSVTGSDAITGCSSKLTTTVVVNLTPLSPVIVGPDSICQGLSATLTATSPGGNYQWYDAATGGTLLFAGPVFQTPSLNSTQTYYVEVLSLSNCTSSRTPVTVTVNPTPNPPVIVGPDSICQGLSTTLTATSPAGIYQWYDAPLGGILLFTGPVFQTSPLNSTRTYYVEVLSVSNCISTRTPVTVTVNPTPDPPVITRPDSVCVGDTATLIAIAAGGTCKWYDVPIGGTALSKGIIFRPVLNDTKTYYAEMESASKCTSVNRTPVTVFVSHVHAEFTADPTSGKAPLKVEFRNFSNNGKTYHWNLGDETKDTTKNVSHTYSAGGKGGIYSVVLLVTDSLGCTDTSSLRIVVYPFSEIIIPNVFTPNDDGKNDLFNISGNGIISLHGEIFNRWGQKEFEWNALNGGWDGYSAAGIMCSEGTYFYIIVAMGEDGRKYELKGSLMLLR